MIRLLELNLIKRHKLSSNPKVTELNLQSLMTVVLDMIFSIQLVNLLVTLTLEQIISALTQWSKAQFKIIYVLHKNVECVSLTTPRFPAS